jgi:hypothetical protein
MDISKAVDDDSDLLWSCLGLPYSFLPRLSSVADVCATIISFLDCLLLCTFQHGVGLSASFIKLKST